MKNFIQSIIKVQSELKAPKNQYNSFGDYKYRSCEDILEALKPLLVRENLLLTINDEVISIESRYYVKATVTITDGEHSQSVSAFAREEQEKKKMDGAQITGGASSYARKYALNAMFLIDDTKDADNQEPVNPKVQVPVKVPYLDKIAACNNLEDYSVLASMIKDDWATIPVQHHTTITESMKAKKLQLTTNA